MKVMEFEKKHLNDLARLFDGYRSFYGYKSSENDCRSFLLSLQSVQASKLFIAVNSGTGRILGFVNLYPSFSSLSLARLWVLNDLFVSEEFRGQGVSKVLLEKAVKFAREDGAIRVELKTDIKNERAKKLYKSFGFKIDENHIYYRFPV